MKLVQAERGMCTCWELRGRSSRQMWGVRVWEVGHRSQKNEAEQVSTREG